MTIVNLVRVSQSFHGTFGVLIKDMIPLCVTLEKPYVNNQNNISCSPAGTYQVKKHNGAHFQNVWELVDVKNRQGILIHNGNTLADTEGCILVGRGFAYDGTIFSSVDALNYLRGVLPDDFTLMISE